uniref:very-long-chain (3R)-3-hydroxyacyl-CoA dehydratase n=1 Tax=Rhodosorus marinus TaxID=101924 RepID=A0A7S3EME0_9RHOD|mmetsp:Transcript_4386/g.18664  ORF Transcript_4386/g.18664 Transcript_4386/m.18664 type:complete len:223 (+) Transcript_4386:255-923(+)
MKLAKAYLFLYNTAAAIGWSLVLGNLIWGVYADDAWSAVEWSLKISQTAAVLEILHCLLGLVRASVFSTILQVSSRIYILWVVADPFHDAVGQFLAFKTMVLAWSLTEIPRYAYFAIGQVQKPPKWMTWLRYSSFMPLYPLGAASEAACLYTVLPLIKEARPYSIYMPNTLNFALDSYFTSICSLLIYIPGLPFMYSHMIGQRAKYVKPADVRSTSASKKVD